MSAGPEIDHDPSEHMRRPMKGIWKPVLGAFLVGLAFNNDEQWFFITLAFIGGCLVTSFVQPLMNTSRVPWLGQNAKLFAFQFVAALFLGLVVAPYLKDVFGSILCGGFNYCLTSR